MTLESYSAAAQCMWTIEAIKGKLHPAFEIQLEPGDTVGAFSPLLLSIARTWIPRSNPTEKRVEQSMSGLLPSLVYPADDSTGQSYSYNYNDIVNVSWSWDGPPGASVFVILWLSTSGNVTLWDRLNGSIPTAGSGSYPSPLNFNDVQYPAYGHFNLGARFKNGTVVGGPNSADITVIKNEAAASQCHSCTKEASSSITPVSLTGNTTSNSANTPDTTSGPLIPPQPTPSGGGLGRGPIAGIVVGVIVAVAVAGLIGVFYRRRRKGGKTLHPMATTGRVQGSPQKVYQGSPHKACQVSPHEVYSPYQQTEHGGTELYELNDSARLPSAKKGLE